MIKANIGIDLGTANVLVYVRGKGVVLREASVIAFTSDSKKIVAVGKEAKYMLGRMPSSIKVIKPLSKGVISDYTITEQMLRCFMNKSIGRQFCKPNITICVPSGVTEVEKRAVEEVAYQVGARHVYIIEEPIAAAIGAGIDIAEPYGRMVVDIGGGTTDIGVISLGGIVVSESIKIAGDVFDSAIIRYIRKNYNILIGDNTAEEIKIKVGSAFRQEEISEININGRDLITGLPKGVTITSEQTEDALSEALANIVDTIHSVIEKTPPELAADIACSGILLTGGGSLLQGLDELIESRTGIVVITAEDPLSCVAIGAGMYVEYLNIRDKHLIL